MPAERPTERDRVSQVLRATSELAQPLERAAVLERVGRVAADAVGADLGWIGTIDGSDHLQLGHVHGGTTNVLETLRVQRGCGLGGKVFALETPVSVIDYAGADSITHEYDHAIEEEGLAGMLCLPLSVGDDLLGVAYVSHRVPTDYSDVMVGRVVDAVESAKLALSIADRAQQITEAAVEVERQRTVSALDASVNGHLREILAVAEGIAADPNSSSALIERATSIVDSVGSASSVFRQVAQGLPSTTSLPRAALAADLTARELEVVQHAAKGLSNPEIGAELFLARGTVKAYMESALRKLGARNRVEAVMIAARSGLLEGL